MPTIILNKFTTNAAIPKVPVYGFFDDFNRADGDTLGVTSGEAKAWSNLLTAPGAFFGIRSNNIAPVKTGVDAAIMSVVDANAANGTLDAIYSATDGNLKIAFRVQDSSNFLAANVSATDITVRRYINNANTAIGTKTGLAITGKTVSFRMIGTAVSVLLDGVEVIAPITVPEYATQTRHGIQTATSGGIASRLDSLRFTPA